MAHGALLRACCFVGVLAPATAVAAPAASTCGMSRPPIPLDGKSIFSAEQERHFGDAVDEQVRSRHPALEDPRLTDHLARIGARLRPHLPAGDVTFRFHLLDGPGPDAFTSAGGHVYVTRKMIASVRSEDELAGILAHEMAHGLAHDIAVTTTRMLGRLGVTRLGDRRDVYDKFHLLLDRARAHPDTRREHRDQTAADRAAIEALACAGYRPQAFAEWWDRFHETEGRTGGWLSDLVGSTRPEMRRLREMLRAQDTLPVPADPPASDPEEFRRWQAAVVAYRRPAQAESLSGVVWKRPLENPLRPEVDHVRFSPDGRYVLAQDASGIFVLTRDPLAVRFRIDAPEASRAQFSPDSRFVVFHTPALRIERWDVATGAQVAVREVARRDACREAALSPDGLFLACRETDRGFALLDVDRGVAVVEKEPPILLRGVATRRPTEAAVEEAENIAFSADGRYLIAWLPGENPLAMDLTTRTPIALPNAFRAVTYDAVAFLGPDRIVGIERGKSAALAVLRFHGGQMVARHPIGRAGRLDAAASGERLLVRPFNQYPAGVVDPLTGKAILANNTPAIDLHGDVLINEARDGLLDVRRLSGNGTEPLAAVELPRTPLANPRVVVASPGSPGWR